MIIRKFDLDVGIDSLHPELSISDPQIIPML